MCVVVECGLYIFSITASTWHSIKRKCRGRLPVSILAIAVYQGGTSHYTTLSKGPSVLDLISTWRF